MYVTDIETTCSPFMACLAKLNDDGCNWTRTRIIQEEKRNGKRRENGEKRREGDERDIEIGNWKCSQFYEDPEFYFQ